MRCKFVGSAWCISWNFYVVQQRAAAARGPDSLVWDAHVGDAVVKEWMETVNKMTALPLPLVSHHTPGDEASDNRKKEKGKR
ncbi:hypothetical protein E2C01_093420 [Portunus trituberculatus]|uniref:Uncharacterized protein n=1 Tax=Portunus trituberculatus TaxID=210409 RepID=A0A5B7JMP5_PORTR|nr:hypothetical protein [Portunus trituberculatus]